MNRVTSINLFNMCITLELASLLLLLVNRKASVAAVPMPLVDTAPPHKEGDKKADSGNANKEKNAAASDSTAANTANSKPPNKKSLIQIEDGAPTSSLIPPSSKSKSDNGDIAVNTVHNNEGDVVAQSVHTTGIVRTVQQEDSNRIMTAHSDPPSSSSSSSLGINSNVILMGAGVVVGMLILGLVTGAVIARIRRRGRAL
ncbi:hypothetical protein BDF19DRAFT_437433 [Syncephalis fuscata]|nr:hypothetical protein BDF19DRAFT_437433 [Syncephalis fuscata]